MRDAEESCGASTGSDRPEHGVEQREDAEDEGRDRNYEGFRLNVYELQNETVSIEGQMSIQCWLSSHRQRQP